MDHFQSNIKAIYGKEGAQWLCDLPILIEHFSNIWGLSQLAPVANLTYNYVLTGFQGEKPIILKLSFDHAALKRETEALKSFSHLGGLRVYETSEGAILMEQAIPGESLVTHFPSKDSEAIKIACQVIKRIHQAPLPSEDIFPNLEDWLSTIDKDWALPNRLLAKARALKTKLIQNKSKRVLLHGDLHQDNIIQHGERWCVIDPKGIIGDPIFDKIGCIVREPLGALLEQPNQQAIIKRRIDIISNEFNLDSQRLLEWTFVQCVMACCWFLEDQHDPAACLEFISILESLMAD